MKTLAIGLVGIVIAAIAIFGARPQVITDFLPGFALSAFATVSGHFGSRTRGDTSADVGRPQLRWAEVQNRSIATFINTTGTITPVALINVSSLVSGQIKELHVDFNTEVAQGDPLATFDPISFQNALAAAEGELLIRQANVVKAQIEFREAEADAQRKRTLFQGGSGSLIDQTKSVATRDLAAAELAASKAAVKKAEAAVSQARTDLDRATIRAPVDGTIINRNVEIGQVLAVSLATPTLFTIAKDLRAMQLDALVSEGDIGLVRVGQRVTFTVDTYPERTFEGDVAKIRKQPQNTQNVVLYTVVVNAPNLERLLLPGMTATTRIIIEERPAALAVPNAALRVRLSTNETASPSRIFIGKQGVPTAVNVKSFATDGSFTQVESSDIRVGDRVVVGVSRENVKPSESAGLVGGF